MASNKGRVPRKLKKKFKKVWEASIGKKLLIQKNSIAKEDWPCSNGNPNWGCIAYPKKQKERLSN